MDELDLNRIRLAVPAGIELLDELGSGGQGTVFRGTCDSKPAAIKLFYPTDDERRVDREIELLSATSCPHLVKLMRHFSTTLESTKLRVLVYELHSGGDLRRYLETNTPRLEASELLKIARHVSMAIDALWQHRIVHRDVKPANIVKSCDGNYVLVDVGFARHVDRSNLTIAGSPGTPGFRSPEQARGRRNLTVHSDIYSLGVTLFVLATRTHPFAGRDPLVPTPANFRPLEQRTDLEPDFVRLLGQMLDFTPAKRPTNLSTHFGKIGGQ